MAKQNKLNDINFGPPTPFSHIFELPLERKYFYIPSLDKYTTLQGLLFTDDDLQSFDRQEREWKESQEDYTFYELIHIFPEAKNVAKRQMKKELADVKIKLSLLALWRENCTKFTNSIRNPREQTSYIKYYDESYDEEYAKLQRKVKKIMFNLSFLEEKKVPLGSGVKEEDVVQAKQVPIVSFFSKIHRHGKMAVAICPFHTDKTPSFTIYLNQNTFWCYSCAYGGTVIDFVMKQQNIDFLPAVKFLLHK